MIQRIQTLWLLFAAAAALLTLKFSFYSGNVLATDQSKSFLSLTGTTSILILILTVAAGVTAFIGIFLYKNRKLQLRLTIAALLVSILIIGLYFKETQRFAEGNYDLTALLSFLVPVFLIMGAYKIYQDQKLVKSLDRLR